MSTIYGPLELADQALLLAPLGPVDLDEVLVYVRENAAHLRPWEPRRRADWLTPERQTVALRRAAADAEADRAYRFGIRLRDEPAAGLVGQIAVSNVSRGAFRSAALGFGIAARVAGRGLMTRAVRLVTRAALTGVLDLHRLQAAVQPHNAPSIRVLEKNGYRCEGLALRYLQIDGDWADHRLFAITTEELGAED